MICKSEGCERPSKSKGYCNSHWSRIYRTGTDSAHIPFNTGYDSDVCSHEGCDRKRKSHGLCEMHYYRKRRHGNPDKLVRNPYNNIEDGEGRWVEAKGYVRIRLKRNTPSIYEHRHVMSEHLGRELTATETVHHKNGDRADNRLSNLELWSTYQPAGQRVSDKIAYALEILELYKEWEDST